MAQDHTHPGRVGSESTKNTYLHTLFHRVKGRSGAMKAIVAVAASMLRSAYYMLSRRTSYQDLGPEHFDRRTLRTVSRLLQRLNDLGVQVIETRIRQNEAKAVSF
jgi:hypothetical protein